MGLVARKVTGWAKACLPQGLKARLKRQLRSQRVKDIRDVQVPVTLEALAQALRDLGVRPGQLLFVHSGADWLRSMNGGPLQVLTLLRDLVGPQGTLAMPSFAFDGLALDYLRSAVFDVRRAPSKMGLLTELFRRLPGVRRSLHPTHSVCAQGPLADELTASHHLDPRPFGPCSPFARMEAQGAQILMLGVNAAVLTHVHVAEDALGAQFPAPVYLPELQTVSVVDSEGQTHSISMQVHNPAVSRLKSIQGHEPAWLRTGVLRQTRVGHIELRLFDAAALTAALKQWAQQGKTIYG